MLFSMIMIIEPQILGIHEHDHEFPHGTDINTHLMCFNFFFLELSQSFLHFRPIFILKQNPMILPQISSNLLAFFLNFLFNFVIKPEIFYFLEESL